MYYHFFKSRGAATLTVVTVLGEVCVDTLAMFPPIE